MSVDVSGTSAFQSGIPKPLFKSKGFSTVANFVVYWDVNSDGQKFIFAVPTSANVTAPPPRFTVVLNWTSLLKK